jgi:hypothetical protein
VLSWGSFGGSSGLVDLLEVKGCWKSENFMKIPSVGKSSSSHVDTLVAEVPLLITEDQQYHRPFSVCPEKASWRAFGSLE